MTTLIRSAHIRYHIELTRSGVTTRTTISLDKIVSDLLSVALGQLPGSQEAHGAVRRWLDKSLSEWTAFDVYLPVSRQATYLAVQRIADPDLMDRLNELKRKHYL
jgi:hypothetical protein